MDEDDRARFESVYRSTYDHLLGYAVRRCDRAEDAADVVAETYLIAWRRIADLPDGEHARMWLFGVAGKVMANHRRGERRRTAWHADFVAEAERLYAVGSAASEFDAVDEAMSQLSDDDRELLALAIWEELDTGQIAQVLGCSRNAVRIRLHRARQRFVKALERPGTPAMRVNRPLIREEMQ
ncbi:RNA polymerase sigma-70 factor (ECF subfamily) [Nonomuraea thailandensis]|uniref:RNA polymerase sigma-70 factor (ECF subfamily) n=1 Tax=Nonomuraea thailandensis TaxID=1188745 RepID=A0A9X2G5R6_9ACTN|nr:RNA polymerase sigma factor [Nonomuraea thailandensis]MCP2353117.1 RNA polymerase sigma-70 factor (ECF subfamily) [Nonomuraea thailandensis]